MERGIGLPATAFPRRRDRVSQIHQRRGCGRVWRLKQHSEITLCVITIDADCHGASVHSGAISIPFLQLDSGEAIAVGFKTFSTGDRFFDSNKMVERRK